LFVPFAMMVFLSKGSAAYMIESHGPFDLDIFATRVAIEGLAI
jgi:hypothetical protein